MISLPDTPSLHLAKVEAMVFRAPIDTPVQTSFGIMYDRPAVLVRIEDNEGAVGWGEIWCNFPSVGAEHRARVLESCIAPILLEREWSSPNEPFAELTRRLRVLAIQSGEPGTMAQAIAGADIALWDLVGKRTGKPLWRLLGGSSQIRTYASGLNPTTPEVLAAAQRDAGHRAFKLKVGFGAERDIHNLKTLRDLLGTETPLMVDANQAWTPAVALEMSRQLAEFDLQWLEEPIAADHAIQDWIALAQGSPIPLAGGENMRGEAMFDEAIASGAFAVFQPDLGKWGGFSACLPVARKVIESSRMFCPHWLGGGLGLVASMHLKAAAGGEGYVEVDSNANPLREVLACPLPKVTDGVVTLSNLPGLGIEPDLQAAAQFRRPHQYV
jgi:L-alanine-DL-glutamate epimerase-like enolase superfamily enzyme